MAPVSSCRASAHGLRTQKEEDFRHCLLKTSWQQWPARVSLERLLQPEAGLLGWPGGVSARCLSQNNTA